MIREHGSLYGEDLMFMGIVAFRYYVPAACRYIRSELPDAHPPRIFEFTGTVAQRLMYEPEELKPVAPELAALCGEILEGFTRFDELEDLMRVVRENPLNQIIFEDDDVISSYLRLDMRVQLTDLRKALSELVAK